MLCGRSSGMRRGHQLYFPSIAIIDGTRMVRTRNVSTSTATCDGARAITEKHEQASRTSRQGGRLEEGGTGLKIADAVPGSTRASWRCGFRLNDGVEILTTTRKLS